MRIAFLIASVHDLGGTANAVVTQANALCERHEVEVLSVYSDEGHHFPIDSRVRVRDLVDAVGRDDVARLTGVEPLLIEPAHDPGLDAVADLAAEATLPALEADVLVTVTPAMLSYAVQLAPPGVAVVHQEHRASSQRASSRELLLAVSRRADVVAMLTEPMAHWLRHELGDRGGDAAPEVVVVPNALPPGFRPRSLLTEPVILSAGRLATEKQWPHLIGAFGRIAHLIPDWRLRIFGEGPGRFEATGAIRKLGLWDRVELPGPTSDLLSEWPRASIMSLTSQPGEGFPLVIQEAMAAGVPVVAYDMPTGPRDQIDDGVDGLLVAQGSLEGLAAALLRLATHADERRRLGEAALAKAATWDSAAITARWEQIFADAVARRHGSSGGRATTILTRHGERSLPGQADHAGRPDDGTLTPIEARSAAFAAAVRVAAGTGARWWVQPPHAGSAPVVCLPMAARRAFVERLREGLPGWLSVHDPERRGWPSRRGTGAEMAAPLLRGRTGQLLLEPFPGGERSVIGRGCEVEVEFWEEGADGRLHATTPQRYTTTMPHDVELVTATVLGVEVPTVPLMLEPTPSDVRFDVDVVYTWVDGSDPQWNRAREERLAASGDPSMRARASSGRARYLDRGELRWSMRALHLFAPWVRRIHLVTAGQVPAWLDVDHPMIHLVDHSDLLPPEALPTFNSHAIESRLHRIDGLSEHFVYLNDDVFVGAPTTPEAFFSPAGATAVFASPLHVGLPGPDGRSGLPYLQAATNNRRLLHDAFGVTTVNTLAHTPHPHRVSVLEEVVTRFAVDVEATTRAPFRSATDVSLLSSLGQHYALLTGRGYRADPDWAYVDITETVVRRRLKELQRRDRAGFCLGEGHDWARDAELVTGLVTEFLDTYFPIAAPWER